MNDERVVRYVTLHHIPLPFPLHIQQLCLFNNNNDMKLAVSENESAWKDEIVHLNWNMYIRNICIQVHQGCNAWVDDVDI